MSDNTTPRVLFVEDDSAVRQGSAQALSLAGIRVEEFESAEQAIPRISADFAGVVVTDVLLPGMDGLALLRHVRAADPHLPVVLVTGHGDIAMAVQAMRDGAYDFIEKPFASDRLVEVTRRALEKRALVIENRKLREILESRKGLEEKLVGRSHGIEKARKLIATLAREKVDVLIVGETGTGKEVVARCLHENSARTGPFVAINCAAIPENLFESELFGHEAGAFSGAMKLRVGKLEHAHRGTLFLDEIESMPLAMQAKLLRALQERRIVRLGSNEEIAVDCRLVVAAKGDLQVLVENGAFRGDLYYRLNVAVIELPPLRERREDIPLLFEHFVLDAARRYKRAAPLVDEELLARLLAMPLPGNVRELRNIADRFVLGLEPAGPAAVSRAGMSLAEAVDEFERSIILRCLERCDGKVAAASLALKIPKKTLYDKIRKYGLRHALDA
jgi:two-component system C4-dicarboxylate transport response regulator DctD